MLKMSYFSRKNKIWEELDSQFWDYFIIFNQVFSKNVLNRNTTKHTISQIKHEISTQCLSLPCFSTKLKPENF